MILFLACIVVVTRSHVIPRVNNSHYGRVCCTYNRKRGIRLVFVLVRTDQRGSEKGDTLVSIIVINYDVQSQCKQFYIFAYALCIIRTRVFNKIAVYPKNRLFFGRQD